MYGNTNEPFNQETAPKVRCFGSRAALTLEATPLMRQGQQIGETLNLDVAPRHEETVSWKNKITVQMSDTELPLFAAMCLGFLPSVSFKRPGKGINIERQPNKLFVSATEGYGKAFALPVPIGQTFQLGALAIEQLRKQTFLQDDGLVIAALRGAAALYKTE